MKGQLFLVTCLLAAASAAYIGGRVKRDSFDCLSVWQNRTTEGVEDFSVLLSSAVIHQGVMDIVQERFKASFESLEPASTTNQSDCHRRYICSGAVLPLIVSELGLFSDRFRFGIKSPSTAPVVGLENCLSEWKTKTSIWLSNFKTFILSDQGKINTEEFVIVRFNKTLEMNFAPNLSTVWWCETWFVSLQMVYRILYDLYLAQQAAAGNNLSICVPVVG